jgi:hypothetical protein
MSSLAVPVLPFVEARARGGFDRNAGGAPFRRVHAKETLNDGELPDILECPPVDRIAAHHALDSNKQLSAWTSSGCQVDLEG